MKRRTKKIVYSILSLLLCVCIGFPSMLSFAAQSDAFLDENGKYNQFSNGQYKQFEICEYGDVVKYFQNGFLERKRDIEFSFALSGDCEYSYNTTESQSKSEQTADTMLKRLSQDIYTKNVLDNPGLGDYLYNSVLSFSSSYMIYMSEYATLIDGVRYSAYTLKFNNVEYAVDKQYEDYIVNFAGDFNANYIRTDMTDYEKVKTIYDFIVRNATYDYDVFGGKYAMSSDRYKIAHSAYGAICGNLTAAKQDASAYDIRTKQTVTNQPVVEKFDQGLAVCEGYSKLFYYLCVSNGIACRIVDGDYVDKGDLPIDAHEWNYVWLDDQTGRGYQWYQVDTTFASQKSRKEIDLNNYDYFLCGTENVNFGLKNHQQPYKNKGVANGEKKQLYDWYAAGNVASQKDYAFRSVKFENADICDNIILQRTTKYANYDNERTAFAVINKDGMIMLSVDEDNNIIYTPSKGFNYTGNPSTFSMHIPYLTGREYSVQRVVGAQECQQYSIKATGKDNSQLEIHFNIEPLDMSNNSKYINIEGIQKVDYYTGQKKTPTIKIKDGFDNELTRPTDYDYVIYSDPAHTKPVDSIIEMGTYYADVTFKGNYKGHYYFNFMVDKIKLSQIKAQDVSFEYIPEKLRKSNKITTPADYYALGASDLKVGSVNIKNGVDYTISSSGGLKYGDSGDITLTSTPTSDKVIAGEKTTMRYYVNKKFNVKERFEGKLAHSKAFLYTGSPIKPTELSNLDLSLVKGSEYIIDSYSNNTNAGKAYVTVKGVNGCSGTAKMYFVIQPVNIGNAKVKASVSNNKVSYTATFNGKMLVKGKDYTESITKSGNKYTITLKGKGNFTGQYKVNLVTATSSKSTSKPSSSGNYIKFTKSGGNVCVYSGKALKPSVKLYNKSKKPVDSYYYTVSYSNNVKVGKAKITVKFRNGYKGTLNFSFTINPKSTTLSSLASKKKKTLIVKWKKQASQTTGYEIQYSTSSKFKNAKTVKITKNSATSKTISKLSSKKKYYVRIRTYKTVSGKTYRSSWSKAKSIKIK